MTDVETAGSPADGRAAASDEFPLYLRAGREHIFAIVTRPTAPANGVAVLCLHAASLHMTSHRNRTYTRLCREAAGSGFMTLRMDYHGTGDSSGVRLDRGVFGQTVDDVAAAVTWLTEQGITRIVVVGTCYGALVALVAAANHEAIVSACLLSAPLAVIESGADVTAPQGHSQRDALGRALAQVLRPRTLKLLTVEPDYRRWLLRRARGRVRRLAAERLGRPDHSSPSGGDHVRASPEALLAPLMQRRVRIHALYGEKDKAYQRLQQRHPSVLEAASDILEITVTPVSVHGLSTLQSQDVALAHVRGCLARVDGITNGSGSRKAGEGSLAGIPQTLPSR